MVQFPGAIIEAELPKTAGRRSRRREADDQTRTEGSPTDLRIVLMFCAAMAANVMVWGNSFTAMVRLTFGAAAY